MSKLICHNCTHPGHYARYCPNPKDMSRVICDYCGKPCHYARNCFDNPSPTYARIIPRNPSYNTYPYQNPWKDYEEYEPYSEGTYHIRPNPLPQHHVAFNKPEVTADYPPISDQDDSGYEKAESQTSGGRGPFTT